jgi:hypothetical protein
MGRSSEPQNTKHDFSPVHHSCGSSSDSIQPNWIQVLRKQLLPNQNKWVHEKDIIASDSGATCWWSWRQTIDRGMFIERMLTILARANLLPRLTTVRSTTQWRIHHPTSVTWWVLQRKCTVDSVSSPLQVQQWSRVSWFFPTNFMMAENQLNPPASLTTHFERRKSILL